VKRADQKTEFRILQTWCDTRKPTLRALLTLNLREDHFGTEHTQSLYRRIRRVIDNGDLPPLFEELPELLRLNRELSVAVRTANQRYKAFKNTSTVKAAIESLNFSYKKRVFADLHEQITKVLSAPEGTDDKDEHGNDIDGIEKIERYLEKALYNVRKDGNENDMVHGGVDGESALADIVTEVLAGKQAKDRIKTGWAVFDQKTGGFDRSNLVVVTANTGGGKSVSMIQLFSSMYRNFGYRTAMVSLEMSKHEIVERMLANISNTEVSKIHLGTMTRDEKRNVVAEFDRMDKSKGSRFTIYTPSRDVTIQEALHALSPFKYDVIFIDYVGLLKQSGAKGAREDQMLGDIVRYAKRMAQQMNCVIVLLAQLNEEGQIRGSRAIGHHANFWFKWECTEEDKQKGFITIEQAKARAGEQYDFYVTADFAHMRMDSYLGPLDDGAPDDGESPKPGNIANVKFDPKKGVKQKKRGSVKMSLTDEDL